MQHVAKVVVELAGALTGVEVTAALPAAAATLESKAADCGSAVLSRLRHFGLCLNRCSCPRPSQSLPPLVAVLPAGRSPVSRAILEGGSENDSARSSRDLMPTTADPMLDSMRSSNRGSDPLVVGQEVEEVVREAAALNAYHETCLHAKGWMSPRIQLLQGLQDRVLLSAALLGCLKRSSMRRVQWSNANKRHATPSQVTANPSQLP